MTISEKGFAVTTSDGVLSFHETIEGAKKAVYNERYFGVLCHIEYAQRHHETTGWPNVRYTTSGYYYENNVIY